MSSYRMSDRALARMNKSNDMMNESHALRDTLTKEVDELRYLVPHRPEEVREKLKQLSKLNNRYIEVDEWIQNYLAQNNCKERGGKWVKGKCIETPQ